MDEQARDREVNGAIPGECRECGRPLVFRAPWWESPAAEPVWGYLVHCEAGHFAWYATDLTDAERSEAEVRFGVRAKAEESEDRP